MKKFLVIAAIILFVFWITSLGFILLFLAQIVGIPYLVGSVIAQIVAFVLTTEIMLVTNTRVGWRAPDAAHPAGIAYGRRQDDIEDVTKELSDVMERAAARQRTGPVRTPDWLGDKPRVTVTKDET